MQEVCGEIEKGRERQREREAERGRGGGVEGETESVRERASVRERDTYDIVTNITNRQGHVVTLGAPQASE